MSQSKVSISLTNLCLPWTHLLLLLALQPPTSKREGFMFVLSFHMKVVFIFSFKKKKNLSANLCRNFLDASKIQYLIYFIWSGLINQLHSFSLFPHKSAASFVCTKFILLGLLAIPLDLLILPEASLREHTRQNFVICSRWIIQALQCVYHQLKQILV